MGGDRPLRSRQAGRGQRLGGEAALDEELGGRAQQDRPRLGQGGEPEGEIEGRPQGERIRLAGIGRHHRRTGVDAGAQSEAGGAAQKSRRPQSQLVGGAHGTVGVVLVGLGIAEAEHQPVAEEIRQVPAELGGDRRHGGPQLRQHLVEDLGI